MIVGLICLALAVLVGMGANEPKLAQMLSLVGVTLIICSLIGVK